MFGLSNVSFCPESWVTEDKLCETKYLANTMRQLSDIFSEFDKFEFSILSTQEGNITPAIKRTDKKNVLIWISDEFGANPNHLSQKYGYIFKSYISHVDSNISPFPLGYVTEVPEFPYKNILTRKYNVFFSGNLNYNRNIFYLSLCRKLRKILPSVVNPRYLINHHTKEYILKIKSQFDQNFPSPSIIRFTTKFKTGFSPEEYGKILSDTKIVLCPKGFHSTECYRHYEAMRAGCIIISERLPDTYLYKDSPIIQIENWNNIYDIINNLLSDSSRLNELSHASREWYEQKLSEKATAERMKSILAKQI